MVGHCAICHCKIALSTPMSITTARSIVCMSSRAVVANDSISLERTTPCTSGSRIWRVAQPRSMVTTRWLPATPSKPFRKNCCRPHCVTLWPCLECPVEKNSFQSTCVRQYKQSPQCGNRAAIGNFSGAPLLLVEGRRGHDVMAAVTTGVNARFRGGNGRRVWQWDYKRRNVATFFPTWDDSFNVLLGRIDVESVVSATSRPIVFAGQDGVALFCGYERALAGVQCVSITTHCPPAVGGLEWRWYYRLARVFGQCHLGPTE
jgi:hypothetical protein